MYMAFILQLIKKLGGDCSIKQLLQAVTPFTIHHNALHLCVHFLSSYPMALTHYLFYFVAGLEKFSAEMPQVARGLSRVAFKCHRITQDV